MISVEKAKELIIKNTKPLSSKITPVMEVLGTILSADVIAPVHLPPFDQSAMDGYAVIHSDCKQQKNIKVIGEVAAGSVFKNKMNSGQAVRIFTGAAVPANADAVVMQEKVVREKDSLFMNDWFPAKGENIRKKGSQIKKGNVALEKGTLITPGSIGFLTAMGIIAVNIFAKPRITVIVTGSELKKPGAKLGDGQIYESNSYALQAVLKSIGLDTLKIISIADNENKTLTALKVAIENSDLVLITGGISVGDYDFVGKALQKLAVENIFYKIKQKPGKPLFFGKDGNTLVFGLPGNPAAVLSCFYEYVYPAIKRMSGHPYPHLRRIRLPIESSYPKKQGISFFLKGKITHNAVTPLNGQESYILSSFSNADCLIYLPEESGNIEKGETVEVHLLPGLY